MYLFVCFVSFGALGFQICFRDLLGGVFISKGLQGAQNVSKEGGLRLLVPLLPREI